MPAEPRGDYCVRIPPGGLKGSNLRCGLVGPGPAASVVAEDLLAATGHGTAQAVLPARQDTKPPAHVHQPTRRHYNDNVAQFCSVGSSFLSRSFVFVFVFAES